MSTTLFTAADISALMTAPGAVPLTPTAEQQAVIESAAEGAALVVAGAGSGKTETIANRVIWLVANGKVRPSAVLGLTFTRKAAGELAERVRGRLITFVERAGRAQLNTAQRHRIDEIQELLSTSLEVPEVSTYNAFAAAVVQEFGSAAGAGGQLIDEAVAWGIARDVVVRSTDPRLASLGLSVDRLTELTLTFAHGISDHLSDYETARQALHEFLRVRELPYDAKALEAARESTKVYASITAQINDHEKTLAVIDLAETYQRVKRERGVLEFSDQISLARQALASTPEAKAILRHRYQAVLLDEVQDTSVAQTTLLSEIFQGSHVMAVGDPHQSIYGWRGASSVSLSGFHHAFMRPDDAYRPTFTLSTSWRNARSILEAANRVALPLRQSTTVPVPLLAPRPGAPEGEVRASYVETLGDEAAVVARWLREQREAWRAESRDALPTAAVILRKRKYMPLFAEALKAEGIPTRIVGVGGLLATPEVRDLVSALRCIWYADASNDLVRVLTHPRFSIAPVDIVGLRNLARWFSRRDVNHRPIVEDDYAKGPLESVRRDVSLVDALDLLVNLPAGHSALATISEEGERRLREAASMFRTLRTFIGADVIDLVRATVRELRIDIELEAHERFSTLSSATARENLNAFGEAVRSFMNVSPDRSLQAVLEWLAHAQRDDELPAFVPPPEPGTVQLITVHSAKGLEWDFVAIPRQSEREFPSAPQSTRGEFAPGTLPDVCRGDRASRPICQWKVAVTQQEVRDSISEYQQEHAQLHYEEELRLIYVAYTRAKLGLFLTGSFWSSAQRPALPAAPLRAVAGDLTGVYAAVPVGTNASDGSVLEPLVGALPLTSQTDARPEAEHPYTLTWPPDQLGSRRTRVREAAEAVRSAPNRMAPDPQALLLIEDERARADVHDADTLLTRVNASTVHDILEDPHRALLRMVRPVPKQPYRRTRIGNLFHDWVEQRTTTPGGTALTLGFEAPDDAFITDGEREELSQLIATFERSRWAALQPVLVEEQITLPFAGRRLVCKLDAVYEVNGRIEIVDWKTGKSPRNDAEKESRFLQLDLYRLAYASSTGIPLEDIDVSLFYVEEDIELRSEVPRTLDELEQLWHGAMATRVGEAFVQAPSV